MYTTTIDGLYVDIGYILREWKYGLGTICIRRVQ